MIRWFRKRRIAAAEPPGQPRLSDIRGLDNQMLHDIGFVRERGPGWEIFIRSVDP